MTIEDYNCAVDDHSDAFYRFILKNIKDKEQAKDIVQDSYEKLWINRANISFSKVKSYLFSTGYHTMIDLLRREKHKMDYNHLDIKNLIHHNQYSDIQEVLNDALQKLPDDQKAVVLLRDYEGYSYKEIEEITGLNEAQVKVYIYRARLFLKNYIGSLETVI